jgi:hypothetical protein
VPPSVAGRGTLGLQRSEGPWLRARWEESPWVGRGNEVPGGGFAAGGGWWGDVNGESGAVGTPEAGRRFLAWGAGVPCVAGGQEEVPGHSVGLVWIGTVIERGIHLK